MRNVFVVILMLIVGFMVGFRIHTNVVGLIAGALLVLIFGFSMSWIFATVGLIGRAIPKPRRRRRSRSWLRWCSRRSAFVSAATCPAGFRGWPNISRCR